MSKKARPIPGAEYETETPPPPVTSVDETPVEAPVDFGLDDPLVDAPVVEEPVSEEPVAEEPAAVEEPAVTENLG